MMWFDVMERMRRYRQRQREAAELAQLNECELAEIRACLTAAEQAGSSQALRPVEPPNQAATSTAPAVITKS